MDIQEATHNYEAWLGKRITLIPADIELKHQRMAESAFSFLRATFYRWCQRWPQICPELTSAREVLSVGDLHVENFGTWRDLEGRLIWGINDFDEAWPLPYANDLVRLATSALVAARASHLTIDPDDACTAITEGYAESLAGSDGPLVLAERHSWLRKMALGQLRDPVLFWDKLAKLPVAAAAPPQAVAALEQSLPENGLAYRLHHRIAGLGSLGRQRFVALADWRGGWVAREAKALTSSACLWEKPTESGEIRYQQIIGAARRVPDPWVRPRGWWIIRRLAPDCSRIELSALPEDRDERKLLRAMGWETANVHAGDAEAKAAVQADLRQHHGQWLRKAAEAMAQATEDDWKQWRKGRSK